MPIKKTNETYVKELLNTEYEALEPYKLSSIRILHRHKKCGHEFYATPNNVLTKLKHCSKCAPNSSKTTEYYKNKLIDHEMLEDFKGIDVKILHRHKICGFEWKVSPHDMQKIVGCPNCSFHKSRFLYHVYFPDLNLHKIGISNSVERRVSDISNGYKYTILKIWEFSSGIEAYENEQNLLKELGPLLIDTGLLKSGNKETFRY